MKVPRSRVWKIVERFPQEDGRYRFIAQNQQTGEGSKCYLDYDQRITPLVGQFWVQTGLHKEIPILGYNLYKQEESLLMICPVEATAYKDIPQFTLFQWEQEVLIKIDSQFSVRLGTSHPVALPDPDFLMVRVYRTPNLSDNNRSEVIWTDKGMSIVGATDDIEF